MLARPTPFARFEAARPHAHRVVGPVAARSARRSAHSPQPAIDRHSTILPIALRTPMDRQALDPPELWCEAPDLDVEFVDDDFAPSRDTLPVTPDEHEQPTVRP